MKNRSRCVMIAVLTSFIGSTVDASTIYGKLRVEDNGYSFTKLSSSNYGMVNILNPQDRIPYDTKEISCPVRLYFQEPCPPENKDEFRYTHRKLKSTLYDIVAPVLTCGLTLLIGHINSRYSSFDFDEYNSAVASAKSKINNFTEIKAKYDDNLIIIENKQKDNISKMEAESDEIYDKIIKDYNAGANVNIKQKIIDKTGFWKKNKIDADINVELNKVDSPLKFYAQYFSDISNTYNTYKALDCDTSQCYESVVETRKKIDDYYHQLEMDRPNKINNYKKYLQESTSYYSVNHRSGINIDNFDISVSAPTKIIRDVHNRDVEVIYTVNSKTFTDVYPKYINSDNNIDIKYDGKYISIHNKTKSFIQIKSIAMYYNDDITNQVSEIELPPDSNIRDINVVPSSKITNNATYVVTNTNKLKSESIKFGFAVKYKFVDQNIDKTAYKVNKYDLLDILRNI